MDLQSTTLVFFIGIILGIALAWLCAFHPKLKKINLALATEKKIKELLLIEQGRAAEKLETSNDLEAKLKDVFKALTTDALNSNNEAFLNLAKANLEKYQDGAKHDLEVRQKSIDDLVKPLTEGLANVEKRVQDLDKARAETYAALNEQVNNLISVQTSLRSETSNLAGALRSPRTRGMWGEIQLRQVVEMAGMLEHCDFTEQKSMQSEDGRLRPDLTVYLPGNKSVVIDAKTPMNAFLRAIETTNDEAVRLQYFEEHAQQLRRHISELSDKNYWKQFENSPEFVILFVPNESFYSAALEHDPELIEVGWRKRILIATPTTLIALLRAVAYGWNSEALSKNAVAVSELGKELYARMRTFTDHFIQLRKGIEATVKSYNETAGSLESRVLTSARKFNELSISDGQEIKIVEPIEIIPRAVSIAEYERNFEPDFIEPLM